MVSGTMGGDVVDDDVWLLRATREGDAAAFGRLYERHAGAALVVARQYTESTADAEDVVADAFTAVHRALLGGKGPEAAFRAYLFTVVRRTAAVHRTAGRRTRPTDDVATLEAASTPVEAAEGPALAGLERSIVARAFRSLPERWQAVLWHTEVEGLTPAQLAPLLGVSANSAAALAYRAREGLRQAYLQQHLQDPLDEGCRQVSGRLGAHVRGGLGARESTYVTSHLEGCGRCRTLVLELGDVNHGMRGVVAPLVLGLLGTGALAHELPLAGGLAAGAHALAHTGTAAAGTGAGAGAGAGTGAAGGGAAGTGGAGAAAGSGATAGSGAAAAGGLGGSGAAAATGAAAAAGGAAAGTAVAGAAAATGTATVVASKTAGLVASLLAAAAVVAATAIGATKLLSGPDGEAAAPAPSASVEVSPHPTGTPEPPLGGRSRPTPTASPDGLAAVAEDDEAVSDEPSAAGSQRPTARPTARPTPTTGPGRGVTDPDPEVTDPAPTPEPTEEPGEPDVVVAAAGGGLSLTAGAGGQTLGLTMENRGARAARELVADIVVPPGVTLQPAGGTTLLGTSTTGARWLCVAGGSDAPGATCTLDRLPAGASTRLELGAVVDEAFVPSDRDEVAVHVTGADGRTLLSSSIRLAVASSPPRIVPDDPAPDGVRLVAGRTREVAVPVRNAGGTGVSPDVAATVELTLPPGVAASAPEPWQCRQDAHVATCRHGALGPFERTTLPLRLTAAPGTAPGEGHVHVRLTPSSHRPAETMDMPYTLVRPATLALGLPAAVDLAPGTAADVPVTVSSTGDLDASDVVLRVAPPPGAVVVAARGPGWTCTTGADAAVCTGDSALAAGTAGQVVVALDAPLGTVGDLGPLTATVTATDADLPPAATAPVGAAAPQLALSDASAVVNGTGGTLTFVASVAAQRADGRPGAGAHALEAAVTLPVGVTLDDGYGPSGYGPSSRATAPACSAYGRVVTCVLGDRSAGERVPVQVPLRVAGAVRATLDVRLDAAGAAPATASVALVASSANLSPVWSGTGDLDVTEVGAPLLGCTGPYGAPCAGGPDIDNNGRTMAPLDEVAPGGPRAGVPVSSATRLDLPAGRDVVWAGLYWSAVRGPGDRWSADLGTSRLLAPGAGDYRDVTASSVVRVSDGQQREYYQAAADVTDLVAAAGGGTWALADVAVSAGRTDRDPTYYAGWALVVVHGTLGDGGSTVTVHQGGSWIGTAATAPAFTFVGRAGAPTRIGVVAWEGDRAAANDRLSLSGVGALTPLRWDGTTVAGTGSRDNAFDSTATGWRAANSLGVDAKGFVEVAMPSDVASLTATTGGDQYLVGVVTVRTGAPAG